MQRKQKWHFENFRSYFTDDWLAGRLADWLAYFNLQKYSGDLKGNAL
jgi:hypothetical protein